MSDGLERSDFGIQIRLFASSYAPLFALLALRFESPWLRLALALAAAIFLADTVRVAYVIPRRVGTSPFTVTSAVDEGGQVAGYLATYLLPFLAVPNPAVTDLAAYGLFLVVVGIISMRSNLTHINPTLYLLGYRLISVTTQEGFSGLAIARTQVRAGDVLRANHLGSHLLVEVRNG